MRCLQCGKKLSLLRKFAKGEFCSAEHRDLYQSDESQLALARLHESQVRIERPTPAAAKAALAAVERLRAMDSSAADPIFVETYQFAEKIGPQNYRRLAWPCVEPLVADCDGELPDRGNRREPLSLGAPGGLFGVVEPSPVLASGTLRPLTSRPQFRLGVRLLTTATGPRAGQMRQAGLSGLPMPQPILRPSEMLAGQFEDRSEAVPENRSLGLPGVARSAMGDRPERSPRPVGLVDVDAILPDPAKFGPEAASTHLAASPLPAEIPAPMDLSLRVGALAVPLIDVRRDAEPAEPPTSEPLAVQTMEPLILRLATAVASQAQGSIVAFAGEFSTSLPGLPGGPTAERVLCASDDLEALELRSVGLGATVAGFAVQPIVAEGCGAAPVLQFRPESRMRPDELQRTVDTRTAAGVRSIREIVAAVTAGELTAALPGTGGVRCEAAGMRQESALMAVGLMSADARGLVRLSMAVELENGLGASLPAHEEAHTTLPRMREATGLQGLALGVALRSASDPATAHEEAQPLSMTAAAGASGPAVPAFKAHPESIAKQETSAKVQETEVVPVVQEPASPTVEAGPPALLRQLPLALGRATGGRVEGFRSEDRLSSVWQTVIENLPFTPSLSLKIDHADGSGSRQGGKAAAADRRPLLPPIDLRSLPGRRFWRYAPADLKWAALGLPLILVFVVYSFRGSQSKAESVPVAAPQTASVTPAPAPAPTPPAATAATPVSFTGSVKQVLMSRAAVNLLDDFRGGLSAWQGDEGWAKTWHYGQATFLEPGNLALYKPSMNLRDYSLEFLGQIQGRSLNWVFRAQDSKNYYAMRIVVRGGGPMPDAQIIQYAVINGKEDRRKVLPTPYPIRPDTMYLVRVDVQGSDFNIYVQGQPMYNFTDDRLAQGGIGFFSPKGDKSFLRWVQVKHQYDYIGRLCAMLAPYQVPPEAAKTE